MNKPSIVRTRLAGMVVVAAVALAACGGGDGETSASLTTYKDPAHGFEVGYPSDWEQKQAAGTVVAFLSPQEGSDDNFRENVNVVAESVPSSVDLEFYTDRTLDKLKNFISDMKVEESVSAKLGSEPAHRIIYTGTQSGVHARFLQVWALHSGTAYVVTYTGSIDGFDGFKDEADRMLDSFEFTS